MPFNIVHFMGSAKQQEMSDSSGLVHTNKTFSCQSGIISVWVSMPFCHS